MQFIPNPNLEAQIAEEFHFSEAVARVTAEIAAEAKRIAPVDTGAYRDAIHVDENAVVAGADHSALVEAGTSDTPAFAPLRRAAETVVGTENFGRRDA